MLAYPEWQMKFRKGAESIFHEKAQESGDHLYEEFWARAKSQPEHVKYNHLDDGIKDMFESQVAIHVHDGYLKQYYNDHPTLRRPKTFPSDGKKIGEYMALSENSPLGPILNQEFRVLFENGVMDLVDIKWKGKEVSNDVNSRTSAEALDEGQVMMIFAVLSVAISVSAAVLIGECLISAIKGNLSTATLYQHKRQVE